MLFRESAIGDLPYYLIDLVLFLVPVFTTFFLFEVTGRQKIHPLQYLMVGAVLCLFLPAVIVDFRICRIQLGVPDRGGRIARVNYVVLPIFPWRRARTLVIGQSRRRLQISLYHFAAAGLRIAHGRDRTLHRPGDRNARNA